MRINYNVSAMLSNNALSTNDDLLSKSLERLSSGLKINHAKDNPAGLAMSKRMNAQIEGLSVANQNASDGVSIIEIADGAMTEISEMLQRINELSVKAANGTMTEDDRATIQDEVAQLKEEITRISDTTEFNGQKLLNGEFDLKGYTDKHEIKVNYCSPDVPVKEYTIQSMKFKKDAEGNLLPDEVRLTKFGAWLRSTSLDELPEAFCILNGTMTLIGPRPQLVRDMVFMSEEQRMRHTAKPGLSGLAQVSGRNAISWDRKLQYDLVYIEHVSFGRDLKILFKTVEKALIKQEGITEEGSVTAADYGDYLLQTKQISKEEYDKKQNEAKELLKGLK